MKTKPNRGPEAIDESTESEITIQPDGRVFAFGITQPLASVLATIPTADDRMKNLLGRIVGLNAATGIREPLNSKETRSCPSLEG